MRHFCLPGTVAALPCGVFVAAGKTRLIALSGQLHGMNARQLRTVTGAVALATVTGAADKNRIFRTIVTGHFAKS